MIKRQNIIELLNNRTNVYHSAILTCYTFDPIYFETIYLRTLRKLGIVNIIIFMDADIYDQLLSDNAYQCHTIDTSKYTLVRQKNNHYGVFHPKMTLLFGNEESAIIVGSGNLTFSGLSKNDEVWSAFHCSNKDSVHIPLIHKAWKYINSIATELPTLAKKQLDWITEQCPWLNTPIFEETIELSNNETASLLYNTDSSTIIDEISNQIKETKVSEITIIASFYDAQGVAIKELNKLFNPQRIQCVIDPTRKSAPYDILNEKNNISFYQYKNNQEKNQLHAKIIEFQTEKGTWILCGSANAGTNALGINGKEYNDEACILLHSKQHRNYLNDLGIAKNLKSLGEKDLQNINRNVNTDIATTKTAFQTIITSCEYNDEILYVNFSQSGIKGKLCLLDNNLNIVHQTEITTSKTNK